MNEEDVKKIAEDTFDEKIRASQYGVTPVPVHTHTGVDSPQVPFLQLSTVPASYTGQAGKALVVNSTENALQFSSVAGALTVKDGSTTVAPVTTIKFTSGATVTNGGGGEADIAISGGGSPGGNDTNVQYNSSGSFAGDDSFDFVVVDADFGLPKITLGNSVGGGVISGGDYVGGGDNNFRIRTNDSVVNSSFTRSLMISTGDESGTTSTSGDISISTGAGTSSAGTITANTGDFNGSGNGTGSALVLQPSTFANSGNAVQLLGNVLVVGGFTNKAVTYTPSAAATATLDLSLSNQNRITMPAGNITIALSNSTLWQNFMIAITQDSGGSRTVTWFTTIKWAGGSPPTLTTTANKRDVFGFTRTGSGTYDGFVIGQNI